MVKYAKKARHVNRRKNALPTNQPSNRLTDTTSYRGALLHLKTFIHKKTRIQRGRIVGLLGLVPFTIIPSAFLFSPSSLVSSSLSYFLFSFTFFSLYNSFLLQKRKRKNKSSFLLMVSVGNKQNKTLNKSCE